MENPINYWYQKYLSLKAEMDKMKAEAVDGEVVKDISNKLAVTAKNINIDGLKFGDKVRITVLPKEDEK